MAAIELNTTIFNGRDTLELLIEGRTEVEAASTLKEQVVGLYGAVTVKVKNITEGEHEFQTVRSYRELKKLFAIVIDYRAHLNFNATSISGDDGDAVLLRAAYRRIAAEVFPIACALYAIDRGTNRFGQAVVLDESGPPPRPPPPSAANQAKVRGYSKSDDLD